MNKFRSFLKCRQTLSSGLIAGLMIVAPPITAAPKNDSDNIVPVAFQGEAPDSKFSILYEDLDMVLRQIVLVTGRSDRSRPKRGRPAAGSHIIRGSTSKYALEGNRVLFPALAKEQNLAILSKIRRELEQAPSQLPLKMLNRNEQLAYWLNLYNVTVLEQIALKYPETRLKKHYRGEKSLWDQKLLHVAGMDLSLNDIQHKIILPKFENPLVMYGMFQGFVGGPNIRNEAYTGDRVYKQLTDNAREFINSNRGMHTNERLMRVSHLYRVNEALFPNWESDLKKHLAYYASNGYYRDKVRKAARLSPKVTDFDIADIYRGGQSMGSAASTNAAAFLEAFESVGYGSQASGYGRNDSAPGAFVDSGTGILASQITADMQIAVRDGGRFPSHVMQYLMKVHERNQNTRKGDVTVEELENGDEDAKPETESHSTDKLSSQ